jgi:hypothetical protein
LQIDRRGVIEARYRMSLSNPSHHTAATKASLVFSVNVSATCWRAIVVGGSASIVPTAAVDPVANAVPEIEQAK